MRLPLWSGAAALAVCAAAAFAISRTPDIAFQKHEIDTGANETCAFADVNGDGKLDIVSGENWFEAPRWTKHHFRDLNYTNNYIDDFSDLPLDVNGDGRIDFVTVSWFSKHLSWWENPGRSGEWKEHVVEDASPIEFAFLVDLDNDGKAREVLPQFGSDKQPLAWYEAKGGTLVKHVVSDKSYGHGIGAGDLNGDGRNDILTPKGWFEAPADPRSATWTWHSELPATEEHLGFMHVLDVNGDKRPDIVTTNAHNYGIYWLERTAQGGWTKHLIDESFSQGHAMTVADLNGDGRPDLITGKRYMAHNGRDPGEREPLGVYWYESLPIKGGQIEWVRHIVDFATRTGGGMQIPVADLDGDGDVDFATAGKSGLYLFENLMQQKGKNK